MELINSASVTQSVDSDVLCDVIHHASSGDEYEYFCNLVPIRTIAIMGVPIREPCILDLQGRRFGELPLTPLRPCHRRVNRHRRTQRTQRGARGDRKYGAIELRARPRQCKNGSAGEHDGTVYDVKLDCCGPVV